MQKQLTLTVILFFIALKLSAQQADIDYDGIIKIDSVKADDTTIFTITTTNPAYKGQTTYLKLFNDLKQNFIFSSKILNIKKEGKSYIEFVIDKKGALTRFKVLKSLHPFIDNEIIRCIKQTEGFWSCAKIYDVDVNSKFVVPYIFKLPQQVTLPKLKDSLPTLLPFFYKNYSYPLTKFKKIDDNLKFKGIIKQNGTFYVSEVLKHTLPHFEKEFLRIASLTQWIPFKTNGDYQKYEIQVNVRYQTKLLFPKRTRIFIEFII